MEYISISVFITEQKFVIKIKKSKQMQNFEIIHNSANKTLRFLAHCVRTATRKGLFLLNKVLSSYSLVYIRHIFFCLFTHSALILAFLILIHSACLESSNSILFLGCAAILAAAQPLKIVFVVVVVVVLLCCCVVAAKSTFRICLLT